MVTINTALPTAEPSDPVLESDDYCLFPLSRSGGMMSSVCGKHPLQSSLFQRYISGGYYNCNVQSTSINQVPVTQYFLYFFSLPSSLCFTDVLQRYMCNEVITSRSGNHYIQCGQCLLTWLIIGLLYFATSAWLDLEIISRSYNYRYLSSLVQLLHCNPFSMF